MKINAKQIPVEGLAIQENISPLSLDLETDLVKFSSPLKVKAQINKITNTVTVSLRLESAIKLNCSRCLNEFNTDLNRQLEFYYPLNRPDDVINIDEDIRQELIMGYPVNPLCRVDCKGLCLKCGKNLNEGDCSCR
jgi:uncharacterized protein